MSEISIPRFVVQALEILRRDESSEELSDVLFAIRLEIIHIINERLNELSSDFPRVMREAIYQSFINNAVISKELVDLENAGWVTFESVSEELSSSGIAVHRRVVIPLVVLYCLLIPPLRIILPRGVFRFVNALKNATPYWHELEDLVAQYEAIKGAAYSKLSPHEKSISLRDYYWGAVVGSAVRDVKMDLSSSLPQTFTSPRRFPEKMNCHSSILKAQYRRKSPKVDPLRASFVLKNAAGAVIDASSPTPSPLLTYLWRTMQMRHGVDQSTAFNIEKDVTEWWDQVGDGNLKNVPSNVSTIVPVFITNRRLRSGSTIDPAKAFGILRDAAENNEVSATKEQQKQDGSWKNAIRRSVFITENSFPKYFGPALGNTLLIALKRMK